MAETENIAKIAERVSDELFGVFGWERCLPRNQNWSCALKDRHHTQPGTHSTDVVFWYDDPYDAGFVYVTVDLKSYAKESIKVEGVGGALRRLGMATECANTSDEFE